MSMKFNPLRTLSAIPYPLAGTQEQLCKSVAHLARIIRAWANLLNKPGKLRRKPRLALEERGRGGGNLEH